MLCITYLCIFIHLIIYPYILCVSQLLSGIRVVQYLKSNFLNFGFSHPKKNKQSHHSSKKKIHFGSFPLNHGGGFFSRKKKTRKNKKKHLVGVQPPHLVAHLLRHLGSGKLTSIARSFACSSLISTSREKPWNFLSSPSFEARNTNSHVSSWIFLKAQGELWRINVGSSKVLRNQVSVRLSWKWGEPGENALFKYHQLAWFFLGGVRWQCRKCLQSSNEIKIKGMSMYGIHL